MMEEGRTFAHRERTHTPGDPARPVELVKHGPPHSQKAKVRWLKQALHLVRLVAFSGLILKQGTGAT
jgi:hypothetical protein